MTLLAEVEQYLARTKTPPAVFGRRVAKDPRLVFDLRNGRQPRQSSQDRVRLSMKQNPDGWPSEVEPRQLVKARPNVIMVASDPDSEGGDEAYQQPYEDGRNPHFDPCPMCGLRGDLGCRHRQRLLPFRLVTGRFTLRTSVSAEKALTSLLDAL